MNDLRALQYEKEHLIKAAQQSEKELQALKVEHESTTMELASVRTALADVERDLARTKELLGQALARAGIGLGHRVRSCVRAVP